jgi:cytochrome c-type biogenesis protein CcmH/NrfG
MSDTNPVSIEPWTTMRASWLAAGCLLVGIAGGWLLRGTNRPSMSASAITTTLSSEAMPGSPSNGATPSSASLKRVADAKAAPLLEQLRDKPTSADLLTSLGNLYYDSQQYSIAVSFYGRALNTKPTDADVRTDMATAYWYMGDADRAIAEFNRALVYQPDRPNTLFNLGLVRWHGKGDIPGALADWEKLLAADPNYAGKLKVEEMMAEAKFDAASQQQSR